MSKKKKAGELTSKGLAKRLFPAEVLKEAKRELDEAAEKSEKKSPTKKKGR